MADIDSRSMPAPLEFGKDAARAEIALQATWQLSAMLGVLLDIAEKDDDIDPTLIRAMAPRMIDLNTVAMAAVSDELECIDSLNMRLHGRAMAAHG